MQIRFPSGIMLLHFCDEQQKKKKLNKTSLEHNWLAATCCCDDVCSVHALSGIENGRFQEVPTDILHHPQGLYSWGSLHTPAMPFHTRLADDDLHA